LKSKLTRDLGEIVGKVRGLTRSRLDEHNREEKHGDVENDMTVSFSILEKDRLSFYNRNISFANLQKDMLSPHDRTVSSSSLQNDPFLLRFHSLIQCLNSFKIPHRADQWFLGSTIHPLP
jgi:hypothetical protein